MQPSLLKLSGSVFFSLGLGKGLLCPSPFCQFLLQPGAAIHRRTQHIQRRHIRSIRWFLYTWALSLALRNSPNGCRLYIKHMLKARASFAEATTRPRPQLLSCSKWTKSHVPHFFSSNASLQLRRMTALERSSRSSFTASNTDCRPPERCRAAAESG